MKTMVPPVKGKQAKEDLPIYLIYDGATESGFSEASVEELDEISQIRQMILDTEDPSPMFVTTT